MARMPIDGSVPHLQHWDAINRQPNAYATKVVVPRKRRTCVRPSLLQLSPNDSPHLHHVSLGPWHRSYSPQNCSLDTISTKRVVHLRTRDIGRVGPRICPQPSISPFLLEEYHVGMGRTTTYISIFAGFSLDYHASPRENSAKRGYGSLLQSHCAPLTRNVAACTSRAGFSSRHGSDFPSIHHAGIRLLAVPMPSTSALDSHTFISAPDRIVKFRYPLLLGGPNPAFVVIGKTPISGNERNSTPLSYHGAGLTL
ncbi:hypothetical protein C8J57DRAFT_1579123 [Mycena rebaudengoi]|nr:hypothetical protein C8J57DRAFT_1579123 [Mycena rebaudengoi]